VKLFLDGAQYRLPDHIQLEGGLGLHVDRNPFDPYFLQTPGVKLSKWRPIQSWISLTDQFGAQSGGLRVVRGFHLESDNYFGSQLREGSEGGKAGGKTRKVGKDKGKVKEEEEEGGGEFFRLNPKTHASLFKRLEPVNSAAGSVVFWDNRLPHATAENLVSSDTREVLFTGYLPDIPLNLEYVQLQYSNFTKGLAPPSFGGRRTGMNERSSSFSSTSSTSAMLDRDWQPKDLNPLQRTLLAIATTKTQRKE
jgi:hypothetical protein